MQQTWLPFGILYSVCSKVLDDNCSKSVCIKTVYNFAEFEPRMYMKHPSLFWVMLKLSISCSPFQGVAHT